MLSVEQAAGKYKSLRFNCIAETLGEPVSQAGASGLSHLEFAETPADHELAMREKKRAGFNLKRTSFPVLKQLEEFDFGVIITGKTRLCPIIYLPLSNVRLGFCMKPICS